MTKKILSIILAAVTAFALLGCNKNDNTEPSPSPSPSPSTAPAVTEPVNIESEIVGQWVPVGYEKEGYMQFYNDGKAVKVTVSSDGEQKVYEQKYYLASDDTFKLVYKDGKESDAYRFEIINDGKTLNIYETTNSLNMPSEFYRIDDIE